MRRLAKALAWSAAGAALAAWLGVTVAFSVMQEKWIHATPRERPEGLPARMDGAELRIPVGGKGQSLAAWWLPAAPRAPCSIPASGTPGTPRSCRRP